MTIIIYLNKKNQKISANGSSNGPQSDKAGDGLRLRATSNRGQAQPRPSRPGRNGGHPAHLQDPHERASDLPQGHEPQRLPRRDAREPGRREQPYYPVDSRSRAPESVAATDCSQPVHGTDARSATTTTATLYDDERPELNASDDERRRRL